MAFTGTSVDLTRLRDAYCAVTAPAPVLPIAQALVVEMGAEPSSSRSRTARVRRRRACGGVVLDRDRRPVRRHAVRIGVERPGRVLGALVRSAVDNALAAADGQAAL